MGLARSRRRRFVAVAGSVALTLALLYLVGFVFLSIGATEGNVPPTSAIRLPAGSEIVSEDKACASGGCWTSLEVRPPQGVTPDELAIELGATPQARIPGTFLNPLTVWLWAEPREGLLILKVDYWSTEWVP